MKLAKQKFNVFDTKKQYKVRLGRSDNVEKLKRTFIDRYNQVKEHNKEFENGTIPYELGIDEFTLLPYEELVKLRTGYVPFPGNDSNQIPAENDKKRGGRAAPAAYSWLNYNGFVRPVQNQGACGSCWAFAGEIIKQFQSNFLLS